MSFTDTANAKKYASISETAAAQAKLYADNLEQAPDYAGQAAASAAAAASSAQSVANTEAAVNALAASASASATQAAASASEAGNAAAAAVSQCLRVPVGESISILPAAADRHDSLVQFDSSGQVSVLPKSGIAILDSGGKIPVSMIPAIALTEPFVVSSQAAMLALDAQVGDIAKRTDLGYSFCLASLPASTLGNWVQLTDDVLAQLGLPTGATQVGATDDSGSNTTVQGALALKASLAALSATNGYTLIPSMAPYIQKQKWIDEGDIRGWGCVCDGVTDDTVNFQNAIEDNKISGKPCIVPEGITLTGSLTLYSKSTIRGQGQERTKLKLLAGSENALLYGANSNLLWGTNSLLGEDGIIVENLTIDADKINNPNGSGIAIYGLRTRIDNVNIINAGKNGIRTEWADSGKDDGGMDGSFSNIIIDKTGEHGWRFAGPHDSSITNVAIISSGQKTASTYAGLWIEKGNARWSKIHPWTSAKDLRSKYAIHIGRAAQGNEFSLSHFEGADTNVFIEGNNNIIDGSCRVYYPWNGMNIRLAGSGCTIEPTLGEEYKGIGLPLAKGIVMDGTYGGPSGCCINIMANGQDAGAIDIAGSGGGNLIRVRGYTDNPASIAYLGFPKTTDTVDLVITGSNLTWFKNDIAITRLPVASVSATGTTQASATQLSDSSVTVNITAGGSGGGVRLPSANSLKNGSKITVANTTGVTINVYPASGHNILGQGVNLPLPLAALKSAEFTVIDGDGGLWVVLKGA